MKEEIMGDTITKIGDSTIQHGKFNNRIYLMKLSEQDFPDIIKLLDEMALKNEYTKIFAKVPAFARDEFTKNGYIIEGHIPNFFSNQEDVYFMGKFFSMLRMYNNKIKEINEILNIVRSKMSKYLKFHISKEFNFMKLNKSHANQISALYKNVFEAYPFPIHDPQYIMKTMDENFIYFSILYKNKIVALSSSEMDIDSQNVEMTDFATLPEYEGNGLATYLLNEMENEMRNRDMKIAYTITRATCISINVVFAKMGYKYGGTLLNNTNISSTKTDSGNFESMNIWYKPI